MQLFYGNGFGSLYRQIFFKLYKIFMKLNLVSSPVVSPLLQLNPSDVTVPAE